LSHSHVRFGTFQRLAHRGEVKALESLLSYSIANYYPEVGDGPDRAARFLARVARASAALCASFMVAGFVHGVLNSDNQVITGEGFDYGPYRFLPTYDVKFTAAYFDEGGLYAFGRQPRAFLRNLVRLGEALRPVAPDIALAPALADFEATLEAEVIARFVARLGLVPIADVDASLVNAGFAFLEASGIGFDRFFFDLHGGLAREARLAEHAAGPAWEALRALLAVYSPARDALPAYFERDRPCSLLIDEIESIWSEIAARDDWGPFEAKVEEIRAMGAAVTLA
jgi:uncharacterized protein YdiU (UPF0061 family)